MISSAAATVAGMPGGRAAAEPSPEVGQRERKGAGLRSGRAPASGVEGRRHPGWKGDGIRGGRAAAEPSPGAGEEEPTPGAGEEEPSPGAGARGWKAPAEPSPGAGQGERKGTAEPSPGA